MVETTIRDRALDGRLDGAAAAAEHFVENGYKLTSFGETDKELGRALAFAPFARNNMFQSLLYRNAWLHGLAPMPAKSVFDLERTPWFGECFCHFHWIAEVSNTRDGAVDVAGNLARFEELLAKLKSQGRKIVWTIHNVLPHEAADKEAAIRARVAMEAYSDAIHVMSTDSVARCEPYYRVTEEKTFYVPHPSYKGAYPDYVEKTHARHQLGLSSSDFVFLCFGAIQKYKGLTELVRSYCQVASAGSKLVIAGPPVDMSVVRELKEISALRRDILIMPQRIAPEDVQILYRAADIALCAYKTTLNSGAAMLALTFGLPVIGPDNGAFSDTVLPGTGILYDSDDKDGLTETMKAVLAHKEPFSHEAISALADSRAPEVISARFCDAIIAHR